jgi:hypothetical protein
MRFHATHLILLASLLGPACVIVDGGDDGADEGVDPTATDTGSEEADTGSEEADTGSEGADTTAGETDVAPNEGFWQYEETPGGDNACTFLADPTNGFGQFEIVLTGGQTFTLHPGDSTDPFECSYAGDAITCDERLTDTVETPGLDAVGNVLVSVEGTINSEISFTGTQVGRIDCVGADCGLAEETLGVAFPCSFTVPFLATAL